jgi:hypothetical protein
MFYIFSRGKVGQEGLLQRQLAQTEGLASLEWSQLNFPVILLLGWAAVGAAIALKLRHRR